MIVRKSRPAPAFGVEAGRPPFPYLRWSGPRVGWRGGPGWAASLPLSARDVVAVEDVRDLVQTEAELTQRDDPREPSDVAVAVEAVGGEGALGRDEQPELVVVMQSPNRQACRPRKLTDLPLSIEVS